MNTVYLSLGSNLGDRAAQLARAVAMMAAAGVHVACESSIYETEPQDVAEQPMFLNTVVEAHTDLSPPELLAAVRNIELEMGRQRHIPKGPRNIDIDILLYNDAVIATPDLEIPHPRMSERRFVLEPLAELAPSLRHPVLGKTIAELLPATLAQGVRRWQSS